MFNFCGKVYRSEMEAYQDRFNNPGYMEYLYQETEKDKKEDTTDNNNKDDWKVVLIFFILKILCDNKIYSLIWKEI